MFTNKHRYDNLTILGTRGDVRSVKFGSVRGLTQWLQGFRICMAAILNLGFWPYWHRQCRYVRQIRHTYRLL